MQWHLYKALIFDPNAFVLSVSLVSDSTPALTCIIRDSVGTIAVLTDAR